MLSWLGRAIHISWLIAWLAIAIVSGIALADLAAINVAPYVLVISAALLFIALHSKARWVVMLIVLSGLIIGIWRGGIEQAGLMQYRIYYGKIVTLQGVVSEDVSYGAGGDAQLNLKDIVINQQRLVGYAWVSSSTESTVRRSDRVTVRGMLSPGFGSIAASVFRARLDHVERASSGDLGLRVRDWFAGGIRAAIPEPEASLASGYLVGQRSTLPQDIDTQLKTVGLTHAVVASGYNLTILVSMARQILTSLSKYLATLSGSILIVGFIMVSGFSPSMARAGLVTSLSLATWYYGRKIHPLVLLPFAAAITALINPFYVWGDIGWYLSFTSFAGVIILAPLVQRALWPQQQKAGLIRQTIVDTMSAQIATLPIMLLAFGHYSPYALLANLLVLPLVPLTMLLTFIAGAIGLALPNIAHLAGWPADVILRYMTWVVAHIAELPGANAELMFSALAVVASYLGLALVVIIIWRKTGFNFRSEATEELAEAGAAKFTKR